MNDLGAAFLGLENAELDCLVEACRYHSCGFISSEATLASCWDADRLELGRVGIFPSAERLCTELARDKDFLAAAYRRSQHPPPMDK